MQSTRYTKALKTATRGYDASAALIVLVTCVWVWPNKAYVAIALVMAVFGAANTAVNLYVIPRVGERRGETLRLVYNLATGLPLLHLMRWPLPGFFWMPFGALFMNGLDKRLARGLLAAQCVATTLAVAVDHGDVMLPIAFTGAAFVARMTAEANAAALVALVDESEAAGARLLAVELELRQAHKMEALGRLAAGVAHEINTPAQYAGDSISFARTGVRDLADFVSRARTLVHTRTSLAPEIDADADQLDLPFLLENLPLAMDRAEQGLQRIASIVRSMRTFAHPGEAKRTSVDLNQAVRDALEITANEYKLVADVDVDLAAIPPVECRADEINQVLLNLIVNAAHAVGAAKRDSRGRIAVRTRRAERAVVVEVEDSGTGIPEAIRDKIMDPFFTTKPVGKGTGQGLAIARTIVEAHGGTLAFDSAPGEGATFRVTLPSTP